MPATLTYSPLLPQKPADCLRKNTRKYAQYAETHPVQPLKGLRETRAAYVSYRAFVPAGHAGCGLALSYRASFPDGETWSFPIEGNLSVTPTIVHCSFYIVHCYTFSAKERDSETGLSYFGSRYYNSDLSIWLSVDPMSDKYPSLSPYVYCADNPIKLVDPNGEEIDIDGYRYIPGQSCPNGVSEKTQNKWNTLNKIYSTKIGETLISEMASTDDYCISISSEKHISADGSGAYQSERKHKSGTLYTNGNDWSVGTIAHELFHGYQDMKGSTGNSVFGEIEARLFATFVCEENIEFAMGMPQFSAPDASQSFYQSLNSLKQSFSLDKMKDFIPHFLSNIEGYGSLDPIAPNQKVLIDKFYPK